MASELNVAYVENNSAEEHLRAIRNNKIIITYMVENNGKVKCMVHHSIYQYGGIRSTINHVYILTRVKIPEIMKIDLSTFIAVMDRILIAEKKMLRLKITEGKRPISLEASDLLVKKIFEIREKRDIFTHLFLVLDC